MDTLIEFKAKGGIWLEDTHSWIVKNTLYNYTGDSWNSNKPLTFNKELFVSDFEGLAAKIAYSVYKEYEKEPEPIEEVNEEHLLFLNFLKTQGITTQFSYNLREFRQLEITDYLQTIEKNKIDLEYCIFMAFPWNPVKFKNLVENTMFWEYHSNCWKKKLNKFRGE